ncbi:SRPBCC family protein [Mycobacteroides chelonae]|uniref:SRPBCC family protein n=1 Tax=Mycobacteroides chelonae TaxID=1774 RepID=UPI0009931E75|nr:SRPBCC family protein [Mycobacteroides chelonae]
MPFHPAPVEALSDFYTRAPIVLVGRSEFDVPVDTLWETVESFEWMPFITAPWKPAAAPGVGSRRRLSLGPLLISTEFVTHIDPGKEIAFYLEELPVPGIRAVAEKLTLTDLGHGRSALTYRIAVAPKFLPDIHLRPVAALARPIFSAILRFGWNYGLRRLRLTNSQHTRRPSGTEG